MGQRGVAETAVDPVEPGELVTERLEAENHDAGGASDGGAGSRSTRPPPSPGWYGESIDLDRVVTWLLWSADHSYANFGTLPADQPANLYQRQPLIGTRI